MSIPVSARGLLGRRSECAALDQLMASVRAGPSRALVLRGEPGVGKSALLKYLVEQASDCGVAQATGIESEMELAFAGLQQLFAPFVDRLERLPSPQRDALRTVFGLRGGEVPERLLVGLAVLSLLSAVAEERPVVCIVDDAHWLDEASAQALAFVARRLGAESVGLVLALRKPIGDRYFNGLPELIVPGLEDPDARELLPTVVTGPLDERVRDRIVAETRGNPLALLELPRGRTLAELGGGFGLSDGPALSGRIEQSFRERLAPLPQSTRVLLLTPRPSPLGTRWWRGGPEPDSASDRTRAHRRPRPDCWISARRCVSGIRSCVRRYTARRRRRSASSYTGRSPRPPMPTRTPIAGPGTTHMRRPDSTRMWRPNWSARPGERERAAGWQQERHFTSAPSSSPPTQDAGHSVRSSRRTSSTRLARRAGRCGCWR
jgi:hypothetical protein